MKGKVFFSASIINGGTNVSRENTGKKKRLKKRLK